MSEFGDAFKAARKAGKMTFEYKGKKYGTRLANETKQQHQRKMQAQSPLSRSIMQEKGINTGYKGELKPMPAAKREKVEAVKVPTKAMPKVVESKPAPAKAVKKKPAAKPSAVSRSQRETQALRDLKDAAMAQRAKKDDVLQGKASRDRELRKIGLGDKKPPVQIAPDYKDRGEQIRAMNEYEQTRKKVKKTADKYKGLLARAAKMFKPGGSLKSLPEGNPGLAKLPKAVRNKMGYAKKGSKMPSYYGGGKMKKK